MDKGNGCSTGTYSSQCGPGGFETIRISEMHIVGVMPTKKLLITGVSGFIGSHFLCKVVEGKEEIVCISRNPAKIATRNPGKRIRIMNLKALHTLFT